MSEPQPLLLTIRQAAQVLTRPERVVYRWAAEGHLPGVKRLGRRVYIVRPEPFHDLRHCHASLLLRQGVHPKVVQERLGHATPGFTLHVYSHLLPGMQEDAVRQLEPLLFSEHCRTEGRTDNESRGARTDTTRSADTIRGNEGV